MEQCCYIPLNDTDAQMDAIATDRIPRERSILATISDCVIIAVLCTLAMIFEWGHIHPHKQITPGHDKNYSMSYPMKESTVPTTTMLISSSLVWTFLIGINGIIFWKQNRPSWNLKSWLKMAYLTARIVGFSLSVTGVITDVIKKFVGSPRPYFLNALNAYNEGKITREEMDNAKQSFISGHASESWALLFLLSIYLYQSYAYVMKCYFMNRAMTIYSCDNPHSYFLADLWYKLADVPLLSIGIIFTPTYFALYVALTRVRDYKHTPTDILGGMLLGAVISYLTFLIYYNEMYLMFYFKELKKNGENGKNKIAQEKRKGNETELTNTTV